ncbi:hypothetical protein CANARDRAFT_27088 [[Candida] arabinofermentans NRRL YB-2248]|uniref:ADP-ribosylation factor-like protein 3 n=1 Tax=[Candida] arabinofermentans NRRL YB-2248 TaxID=983967 RepID=A0A1E4T4J8_9ASCO|nr:hypothetical protein CANARDRAFT_27088 [[Candida] arabinofermentans NRRL YB-2248]
MFHLVKGLYDSYNKKEEYSVLILGLDNAGKTTFLEQLKSMYIPKYKKLPPSRILPTMGQNVGTIQIPASSASTGKPTLLKFWDVGGQHTLREFWSEYYTTCHAIIFIIDSCDKERLLECSSVLSSIVTENEDVLEGLPILMLANKMDVELSEDGTGPLELVDIKEIFNPIAESLSARDSRVLPISAITGEGVKEAIDWLHVRLSRNKASRPPSYK